MSLLTALYVRVSSREQALQGYSLDAQELKCRQYAELIGLDPQTLVVYKDDGYSAKSLDRPRMQQMLKDIRAGKIQRVIVYKLDRLTRSVMDVYRIMQMFLDNNCSLMAIVDNLDLSSANGRMLVGMLSIIAQWEREVISERTRDGLIEMVNQGKYPYGGPAPYGWIKLGDGRLGINEKEAAIKNAAADLILEGYSMRRACLILDEQYGKKCSLDTLKKYLLDKKNCGIFEYNGVEREGFVPAIMDKAKFEKVCYYMSFNEHRAPHKDKYLFHSLVYCSACGSRLQHSSTMKKKKDYRYYACPECGKRINQDFLVHTLFFDVAKRLAELTNAEYYKKLEKSLKTVCEKVTSLEEEFLRGNYSSKAYLHALESLQNNEKDLRRQLHVFDVTKLSEFYELDVHQQYMIMNLIVARIDVDLSKKIVIHTQFKDLSIYF